MRTSWGRPESTSQERPLNVRLRRPLDFILGRPRDVRSGRPRDGQIGSSGDVLVTLEGDVLGTSWGPIFAGWDISANRLEMLYFSNINIFVGILLGPADLFESSEDILFCISDLFEGHRKKEF